MNEHMPSDPEMEKTLSAFRDSVQRWSGAQPGSQAPEEGAGRFRLPGQVEPAAPPSRRALRWAAVFAAVALAVAVPLWKKAEDRRRQAADTLLWEQVNAQVARPVPTALEPLMKLMVWKEGETQ